jgi:RNA polymerase sigma-70 factor (ECF subfamily)
MSQSSQPGEGIATDDQLIARFADGDRAALDELFRRYRQAAYRVAHRLLGNEADALDAVQEGFIKALTHLEGFQGRSAFKTWLLRVVSNAALDLGRSRGRREVVRLDALSGSIHSQLLRPDESDQALQREELGLQLADALATLTPIQRQTFVLYADAELSYREVAEATGASLGTVMSRLFYARQKLRAYLTQRIPI